MSKAQKVQRVQKLYTTPAQYPVSGQLASTFNYKLLRGVSSDRSPDTVDVVSPGLCDDVLKYIGPSLEQHKGCDIIDIHPGACLWSKKLHDYLKPRRHLLMEPEEKYVKPFIAPLLSEPNSAYRHTLLSGAHPKSYFESYKKIFDDVLLPKRESLPPGDARLRQPNNTLLVTGTLLRRYKIARGHTNGVQNVNLLLNHMIQASQTNALFHSYGLVRMIFWHPDETKNAVLPDSVVQRSGYGTGLELAADMVEIAGREGPSESPESTKRPEGRISHNLRIPEMEQVSASRVLDRMDSTGIHMPDHRQPTLYRRALERKKKKEQEPATEAQYKPIQTDSYAGSLEDQITAQEAKLEKLAGLIENTKKKISLDVPYDYKFTELMARMLKPNVQSRVGPLVDIWTEQLSLETRINRAAPTGSPPDDTLQQSQTRTRVLALAAKLREVFPSFLSRTEWQAIQVLLHEIHGLRADPPLLARDRRPLEPLTVDEDEFWPRCGMFLLDIQPRADNLATDLVSPVETNAIVRDFTSQLFQTNATRVPVALDRIGPNAALDLIPAAPELTDASKGGRLDAEDVIVKQASRDAIRALAAAYLEWPFRPMTPDAV